MMGKTSIYLWSIVIFCLLHIIATIIIFFRLKILLRKADLEGFKRVLGVMYKRRAQTNGYTKYKWKVGLLQIRASFDEEGKLVEWEIRPYHFFPFMYRESLP